MNSSETIAVVAIVVAAVLTAGLYWWLPYFPWWAYLLFGLFVTGSLYGTLLQQTANEKIIDRGDWPNREK